MLWPAVALLSGLAKLFLLSRSLKLDRKVTQYTALQLNPVVRLQWISGMVLVAMAGLLLLFPSGWTAIVLTAAAIVAGLLTDFIRTIFVLSSRRAIANAGGGEVVISQTTSKLLRLLYDPSGPLTRELLLNPSAFGLSGQVDAHAADAVVKSVCGYCSTGCNLNIHMQNGEAVSLSPATNYPVNHRHGVPQRLAGAGCTGRSRSRHNAVAPKSPR
jgi:hypothetical protein